MRLLILILAGTLAGCSTIHLSPVIVSERSAPQQPVAQPGAPVAAQVNGKHDVGPRNFANAKKVLPAVFAGLEEDIYCGCRYIGTVVHPSSCDAKPRKNAMRAGRIEWEHVVPAWVIGHQRRCWKAGGRKDCTENDPVFQLAEGDLNNLVPAIGEINGDRNNFAYGVLSPEPSPMYGSCATVVDFKAKSVQPRPEVRGRLARITLYMSHTYKLALSTKDKKLMCAWAKTYPVDHWERTRDQRIVRWQGRGNPLVTDPGALKSACR